MKAMNVFCASSDKEGKHMKVSMNWIREYTDIPLNAVEYRSRMVMSGTGIEEMTDLNAQIQGVVAGRVLTCAPHENSDHLHVCKVDIGQGEPLQIVCGAPNVSAGILVPVAVVGARLPGGLEIKVGKIRGVESFGMLCSGTELAIPNDLYPSVGDAGLLIFHDEYPLGMNINNILGLNDTVIDFEILANRPDCLSVWGIARETSAVLSTRLALPEVSVKEAGGDIKDYAKVTVLDTALCPRYAARVIDNVRIAPSPQWLRACLHAAGIRSINNIVDITNYIMLETGHPMHAFDLDQVSGKHIIVRKAVAGESLQTLDGKIHALEGNELLICDENGPIGLAGIMGGKESEITDSTHTILFECASFDRTATRIAARGLGIRTESSGRFERGVYPETAVTALNRACQMINRLDAGTVVSGVIDLYANPVPRQIISASCKRIAQRTGIDLPPDEILCILQRLYFSVRRDGDSLSAIPPDFRHDVEGEADLCEEVLRLYGYDRIPCTNLRGETTQGGLSLNLKRQEKLREILSGMGFDEVMTYSFFGLKLLDKLGLAAGDPRTKPIRIRNPLGDDTAFMRTTLAPHMLQVLSTNMNRGNNQAAVYEFGAAFDPFTRTSEGLFPELPVLCIGMFGGESDFFSLRSAVQVLLEREGVSAEIVRGGENYHHPGRCAKLMVGNDTMAVLGEVHPAIAERFELTGRAYLAEIDLTMLYAHEKVLGQVSLLSKTPAVHRDIALVVADIQPLGPVMKRIRETCGERLEEIRLFDVYRGEQTGEGKKSAAFALTFRAPERTLADPEVNALMDSILNVCKESFGAVLRA
jgi:phenylalanyl-tRNA synthetase beta chain